MPLGGCKSVPVMNHGMVAVTRVDFLYVFIL